MHKPHCFCKRGKFSTKIQGQRWQSWVICLKDLVLHLLLVFNGCFWLFPILINQTEKKIAIETRKHYMLSWMWCLHLIQMIKNSAHHFHFLWPDSSLSTDPESLCISLINFLSLSKRHLLLMLTYPVLPYVSNPCYPVFIQSSHMHSAPCSLAPLLPCSLDLVPDTCSVTHP